jgi:chemotaxis methyl-accepting protein methylase
MALRQVDSLAEYADLLIQEPDEVQALAQDFLIRVTGFFRDPETFAVLSEVVFPALFDHRATNDPIRIWVPGCSSGEEAYSFAMVLLEFLADRAASTRIQIFGTDLSEAAIEKARTGIYLDSIADEVSPERLQRHFTKLDGHYQVSQVVRDLCVFARHDVTRDPPFSRLDLVSCRNLLIYLDQSLQQQLIPFFHYSLNPEWVPDSWSFGNDRQIVEIFSSFGRTTPDLPKAAGAVAGCTGVFHGWSDSEAERNRDPSASETGADRKRARAEGDRAHTARTLCSSFNSRRRQSQRSVFPWRDRSLSGAFARGREPES